MKKRNTKRSLFLSIMALVLCCAMLAGTTLAWFTDTASTAVNKIQAGTLDVQMLDESGNSLEGGILKWARATDSGTELVDSKDILWEPGCTYDLQPITIKNNGDLKLKYKIIISGIQGDAELNDAIEWTINDTALETDHFLDPEGTCQLTISGHMKEEAGNDYQDKSIDGVTITVLATQAAGEYDSFTNDYDASAAYPVAVAANIEITQSQVEGGNIQYKVARETTVSSAEKVGDTDTPVAKATIPAGAAVQPNQNQLELTIDEVATPGNFSIGTGQDATTYEIDMKGLDKDANTELFKIELYVGTNKDTFKLYHNGASMTKVYSLSDVDADQEYYYNSTTGVVTFLTKTFSPFTSTYYKDSWSNHAAAGYATPVDTTTKTVTIASAEELALFGNEVSSATNYSGYTVNIINDIDLGRYTWQPIKGTGRMNGIIFNGNNHTISNMVIQSYAGSPVYGTGFVGDTNGAITWNDLTFDNADVSFYKGHYYSGNIGGVVMGYTYGTTVFNNVSVTNSAIYGFGKIGAILGMGADPGVKVTFKGCTSSNNTIAAVYDMGGLAGLILRKDGTDNATIQNCTVENISVKLSPSYGYVELDNVQATFKSDDKQSGYEVDKTITGKYWDDGDGYYWGGYADYYVSYGNGSYDAPITTEGEHAGKKIANSEICINK